MGAHSFVRFVLLYEQTTVQQKENIWSQHNVYSHLGTNMTVCEYECVCQICEP